MSDTSEAGTAVDPRITDTAIRLGLLYLLAAWCIQIVTPFATILIWAAILAIVAEPAYRGLKRIARGNGSAAATLFVLLALTSLFLPTLMLGASLVDYARELSEGLDATALHIPPPPDSVADWPLIGESIHRLWSGAALNLASALAPVGPELAAFFKQILATLVGTGLGLLQFAASLVIAGVMLAQSERAPEAVRALGERLAGPRGRALVDLAGASVQGVAKGVLGVAALQATLAAIGFMLVGIPGAGLWALLVLVLAVIQIGPAPVMLPVAIYVFSITGTFTAVIYLVWSIAVMLLDNILKPILIGRGVNVPTLVIFVGAIGGFITSGIIGLFVGAVLLSIAYQLFIDWLYRGATQTSDA